MLKLSSRSPIYYDDEGNDIDIRTETKCKPAVSCTGDLHTPSIGNDILLKLKPGTENEPICIYPGGLDSLPKLLNKRTRRKRRPSKFKSKGI